MKVAVVTDIHGNIHALEAVLEDIAREGVDEIVVAGDTVNIMPDSKACWDRVMALGHPVLKGNVLKGNHESYLCTYGTPEAAPEWSQERFKGLAWLQAQFSQDDLSTMAALPVTYTLPDLLITHASHTSLFDSIEPQTPQSRVLELFGDVREALIVRGHNHKWLEHRWPGHTLVTVNSCGLPLTGVCDAPYLLLERREAWHYEKRQVPYDVDAALATMDENYLEQMGPLGPLFRRELQTARNHLTPFLYRYLASVDAGELTLTRAVETFLTENT